MPGARCSAISTTFATRPGLDLPKTMLQVHGADGTGRAVLRKTLRRAQVLEFFSQLPSCVVAIEACGSAQLPCRTAIRPLSALFDAPLWRPQSR